MLLTGACAPDLDQVLKPTSSANEGTRLHSGVYNSNLSLGVSQKHYVQEASFFSFFSQEGLWVSFVQIWRPTIGALPGSCDQ